LDIQLPDGTGVDVCREVRPQLPDTACLMLTSFDDDPIRRYKAPADPQRLALQIFSRCNSPFGGCAGVLVARDF
jgi:CheY-like chemotaxis protein